MAAMHDQASAWQPPSDFQRHSLDADGFMGETPFWGRFWDIPGLTAEQRDTLTEARVWIRARLSEYGKDRGTYSMIHADLRSANVLVQDDRVFVIDFDDAGFGWHQYDLAATLFDYATSPNYEAIRDALLAGYQSRRSIPDEDLALLPMFLVVRMLAALGWLNDRPEVDLHEFLLAREGRLGSRRLGEEIDLTGIFRFSPNLSAVGGISYVVSGDALAALGRLSENMTFAYLMLDATF
jgi:Ser/Thr protein kinase RdoA (MazF antagonist)